MNLGYRWWIEGGAYRELTCLPKRKRRLLENALEALASAPFRPPLLTDVSADGDRLDVIEAEDYLITYHVDHATRRVLVIEITSLA